MSDHDPTERRMARGTPPDPDAAGEPGESRGESRESQGESRVDELFTRAMDQQLAEQRTLNRIVTRVDEALVALRDGLGELSAHVTRETAPVAEEVSRSHGDLMEVLARVEQRLEGRGDEDERAVAEARRSLEEHAQHIAALRDRLAGDFQGAGEHLDRLVQELSATQQRSVADLRGTVESGRIDLAAAVDTAVGGAVARLAALLEEEGRGTRSASQDLARRLEIALTAAVERLDDSARAAAEQSATSVLEASDRVREDLAALPDVTAGRLDERVGALRIALEAAVEELTGSLSGSAEALSRESAASRAAAAEQLASLQAAVAEALRDLGTSVERVEAVAAEAGVELRTATGDAAARLEEVLTDRLAALTAQAEAVRTASEGTATQLRDAASEMAARGDAGAERVDTAVRDATAQVTEVVALLRGAMLEEVDAARERSTAAAERMEAELAATRDATAAGTGQLREEAARSADTIAAHTEESVAAARAALGALVESAGGELSAASTAAAEAITAALEQAAATLADRSENAAVLVGDRSEAAAATLVTSLAEAQDASGAHSAALRDQVAALQAALEEQLDALGRGSESAVVELRGSVAAAEETFDRALATTTEASVTRLEQAAADVVARIEALHAQGVAGLEGATEAVAAAAGDLHERSAALGDRAESEVAAFQALREGLRADVEGIVSDLRARADEVLRDIGERGEVVLDGLGAAQQEMRHALQESLREAQREQAAELAGTAERLEAVGPRLEQEARERGERLGEDLLGRVDASLARLDDSVARGVDTQDRIEAGIARAVESARDTATDQVEAVRHELAEVAEEAGRSGRRLSEAVAGMQRMQDSLLEYLSERDRSLEADRDALLAELIEEFATGMSRKEVRRAAARLDDVRQRNRDRHDAERWREATARGGDQLRRDLLGLVDTGGAGDEEAGEPGGRPPAGAHASRSVSAHRAAEPGAAELACPVCGFVADNLESLSAHERAQH